MGSIVGVRCKCGYESDYLELGCGWADVDACIVPIFCDHCEIVDSTNLKIENINYSSIKTLDDYYMSDIKMSLKCKKCRRNVQYYGEVGENTLLQDKGKYIFMWEINIKMGYILRNKLHYCPKCKEENLKFFSQGLWD